MKRPTNAHDSRFLTLGAILTFALVLAGADRASATPVPPLSCAGVYNTGGCPPYGEISFGTGSAGGSLFEYDESVALDYIATGSTAIVQGVVDLAAGIVRVRAIGIEDGNPSTGTGGHVIASGTDVFTLSGISPSGFATIGVELTADGTGSISNPSYSGQATISLGVPGGGGGAFDIGVFQAGNNAPLGTSFALVSTIHPGTPLRAFDTHILALDTPFVLSYSVRADVSQGTTFDLMNTAHLNFVLPDGVTISSLGGYRAGGATTPVPAPEPATLLLLSSGLLVAARRLRPRAARPS